MTISILVYICNKRNQGIKIMAKLCWHIYVYATYTCKWGQDSKLISICSQGQDIGLSDIYPYLCRYIYVKIRESRAW